MEVCSQLLTDELVEVLMSPAGEEEVSVGQESSPGARSEA